MSQLRQKESFKSCMERLVDESEEVGVYACSQGMFDSNQPAQQPHIIGGYIINEEDNKSEEDDDNERALESINKNEKYVFIRLYNSVYKNGGFMTTFGKVIKNLTGTVNDAVGGYTHAAISYKLTDDFFGLTSKGKGEKFGLKRESVLTPKDEFTKSVDINKSQWSVYALPVSLIEYEKVKKFLELEIKDKKLAYGSFNLLLQAIDRIGKNIILKKEISSEDVPQDDMIGRKEILVCSTFVAYTLCACTNYKHIFKRYGLDYNYISPNDLASIPGAKFLCSGYHKDYNKLIKEFVNKNKEFNEYLTSE